ncbi:sugar O-acetyltransferase [Oscillibacter sp.]|uniref:sugar O-acetyltransferase n=1 Tax=Oscillibacter sp. TaxID=1945593 RepID=UPI002D7E80EB|nr:sugar O-acetyltransferase [Oscillibacter sp.]
MTEKEKARAGQLYFPADPELFSECQAAKQLCFEINHLHPRSLETRDFLIRKLLGKVGASCYMEPPFYFDYGYNTIIGDHFYSNHNLTVLDCARVLIGDHVFIAPNVGIYTAAHPLDAQTRNSGMESAAPVTIEDNVWIGGSACILPGVTIGEGAVIGAGSVVANDIPPRVLAVGNPCRPVRPL